MFQKLNASIIVPATSKKLVYKLEKSLNERFTDFELIPVYNSPSMFFGWSIGLEFATKKFLILTHQDVEFYKFPDLEEEIRGNVGMIGVAGSKVITKKNPYWFGIDRQLRGELSGSINYKYLDLIKTQRKYGPYGEVVVLDGVCLVTTREIFGRVGVSNLSWSKWDFYDHALCMEYLRKGYKLATSPIKMAHFQLPLFKREYFKMSQEKFVRKYMRSVNRLGVDSAAANELNTNQRLPIKNL